MGGVAGKPKPLELSPHDRDRLARKCKSLSTAYSQCMKANTDNSRSCSNLETSLVTCYAGDLAKEAADKHQRCYMSLMNSGGGGGKRNCDEYVEEMKQGLRKYNLYPFITT